MYPNHRGGHGGFGPGADNHGPGFAQRHFDAGDAMAGGGFGVAGGGFGHRVDDHMDAGLNFHEDERWGYDDDRDAVGERMNFFDEGGW